MEIYTCKIKVEEKEKKKRRKKSDVWITLINLNKYPKNFSDKVVIKFCNEHNLAKQILRTKNDNLLVRTDKAFFIVTKYSIITRKYLKEHFSDELIKKLKDYLDKEWEIYLKNLNLL